MSKDGSDFPLVIKVVENDLCIACGACIQACPGGCISGAYSEERGAHEVQLLKTTECGKCEKWCDKVCPGVEVNFLSLVCEKFQDEIKVRLGPVNQVKVGYSPVYQFDGVSSSGGVIKALIENSLAEEIPVICLAKDDAGYSAQRIESINGIGKIPGSIYHSVSFEKCIELLKKSDKSCLIVAIPCVLEGLNKYVEVMDPSLEKKIHLRVGLICGWMYSDHSWKSLARYRKIPGVIKDIRYRGEDKVGKLKIATDNRIHVYSRKEFECFSEEAQYKTSYSRVFNRLRCRLCENHVNQLCDIAVGDAWLQRYQGSKNKMSLVVIRTLEGRSKMEFLAVAETVVLEPGSGSDIIESQSKNLVFGEQAKKLSDYRSAKGLFVPSFVFSEKREASITTLYDRSIFAIEGMWRFMVRRESYRSYYYWMCIKLFPQYARRRIICILRAALSIKK